MRRSVAIAVVLAAVALATVLISRTPHVIRPHAAADPATVDRGWSALDAQARCDASVGLITRPDDWPTLCRWRQPTDVLQGQSFPPPTGDPPYDSPHIEIYVDRAQTRQDVARAIAHELGHMRHTREPTFAPAWLAARSLPPDTPPEIWTEDYAEVFAALFAPPSDRWRAPTIRPNAEALEVLRENFFA